MLSDTIVTTLSYISNSVIIARKALTMINDVCCSDNSDVDITKDYKVQFLIKCTVALIKLFWPSELHKSVVKAISCTLCNFSFTSALQTLRVVPIF